MPRKSIFANLLESVARPFRHEAEAAALSFDVELDSAPRTQHRHRLQAPAAGAKNLLSNAFKFTEHGGVRLNDLRGAGGLERGSSDPSEGRLAWSRSKSPTPASASRPRSRRSSSKPSSRPTPAPAASMAARASALRSAANLPTCWAARFSCAARPARAARSRSTCPTFTSAPPRRRSASRSLGSGQRQLSVATRTRSRSSASRTTADDLKPGDLTSPHRRGRSALCARPRRSRARSGLQGA